MNKVIFFLSIIISFNSQASIKSQKKKCTDAGFDYYSYKVFDTFTATVVNSGDKHTFVSSGDLEFKIQNSSQNSDELYQTNLMNKLAFSAYLSQSSVNLCADKSDTPNRLIAITLK